MLVTVEGTCLLFLSQICVSPISEIFLWYFCAEKKPCVIFISFMKHKLYSLSTQFKFKYVRSPSHQSCLVHFKQTLIRFLRKSGTFGVVLKLIQTLVNQIGELWSDWFVV